MVKLTVRDDLRDPRTDREIEVDDMVAEAVAKFEDCYKRWQIARWEKRLDDAKIALDEATDISCQYPKEVSLKAMDIHSKRPPTVFAPELTAIKASMSVKH